MESFIPYINEYGYWILVIGALIEGEGILLLAGGAAYFGYFSLPTVMLFAFVGAIIHDQVLYFVGRWGGMKLFQRSEKIAQKAEYAFALLKKYDLWLIMGFRFVYGVRTITPMVIGASELPLPRYTTLTIVSAAIWAILVSCAGYLFANALESIIETFHTYEKYLAIGLGVLAVVALSIYFFKVKKIHKS